MSAPTGLILLLNNATATGNPITWPGGDGTFDVVCSTFNGATVALQMLGADGTTWLDVGVETTLTANGGAGFRLSPGIQLKATVRTAVPSAGVYARIASVKS